MSISTYRGDITLPADVAQEILQKTQKASAIMNLARQIALPGRGVQIPVITSDPQAGWVDETDAKPVSNPGLTSKLMQAYKLAVIVPFSDEFVRDAKLLYDVLISRLPTALATKFDATVTGGSAPGANFDVLASCTAQSLVASGSDTAYSALVAAYDDIAAHGGNMNGIALSPAGMGLLLAAVDADKRPLFNNAVDGGVPRALGCPIEIGTGIYKAGAAGVGTAPGTPAKVGIAGDWTQAMYGTVEGVKIRVADQTGLTINSTQVNLWEHNMIAVRAEIEIGFRANTDCFNILTGAVPNS